MIPTEAASYYEGTQHYVLSILVKALNIINLSSHRGYKITPFQFFLFLQDLVIYDSSQVPIDSDLSFDLTAFLFGGRRL